MLDSFNFVHPYYFIPCVFISEAKLEVPLGMTLQGFLLKYSSLSNCTGLHLKGKNAY